MPRAMLASLVVLIFLAHFVSSSILTIDEPDECVNIGVSAEFRPVSLDVPIVFYREHHDMIFVNPRGVLSFDDTLVGGYKPIFNIQIPGRVPPKPRSFLTALWAFPNEGEYCYWRTTNISILNNIEEYIETDANFEPKLLFVATWHELQIMNGFVNATFQVVIATDGVVSYSQFRYGDIHSSINYLIGFDSGDGMTGLELADHTGELTPEIEEIATIAYRIDGSCIAPATSCQLNSFPESCSPDVMNIVANCSCVEGYNEVNVTCIDIDECEENTFNCSMGLICFNIDGSFRCEEPMTPPASTIMPTKAATNPRAPAASNSAALISGLVVGFVLIIVIGVVIIIVILLTRRKNRWLLKYGVETHDYIEEIHRPSLHYAGSMMQLVKLPKELKVPFDELEFEAKMIGEGEFGTVYRAKYNKEAVAVKILKGISGTFEIRQVVEEIMRMKKFSHPNILTLTGVAIDNHFSPCIIMPFMWNGSLERYLQKEENADKYWFHPDSNVGGYELDIATGKLLEMCLQIAKGMEYLSSEKIIHRDLAARNCMMDYHNVIKVADFGLSVTIGEDKDYFRLSDTNEKLPVKWMAVESLVDYKFSEASDVWSYGVTCWEVFNGGRKPYPEIRNKDILREVIDGYRMKKPPNRACNTSMYNVMQSCWKVEPEDRPNFTRLVSRLSSLLYEIRDYLPFSTSTGSVSRH